MRQLWALRERWIEADRREWQRSAMVACVIANAHRGKRRAFKLADFMPSEKKRSARAQTPEEQLAVLKGIFGPPGGRRGTKRR
jgi:hypothetical protein